MFRFYFLILSYLFLSCSSSGKEEEQTAALSQDQSEVQDTTQLVEPDYCNEKVTVGAQQFEKYLSLLEGKKVAVVGNQSSMVDGSHLVDTLIAQGVDVIKVFSPEHGFRGKADAGEKVNNETDSKTGLPIYSLYGKNKKPSAEQLQGIDVVLFDIQDVGARFYTYISTLTYVMEAAAENGKEFIVLDRPNPNGHYVAGPVLETQYRSFVGMHTVPVVHGMTIGEYAKMVDGEGWIKETLGEKLTVISCEGWDHTKFYELPIAPSPNLPNMTAVYLYPSLCLFEGTVVSIGRGTDIPFQCVGYPGFDSAEADELYHFTPAPNEGAKHPKLEGEECHGYNLSTLSLEELRSFQFDLSYLMTFYIELKMGKEFFLKSGFINNLAGTNKLKQQILEGVSLKDIEAGWDEDLEKFKSIRERYLLYPDFD
ncbi:MAG: DUF1343 domain-containing protein [Flavobacteriales bacterium]|nr:DUF1343 domain-containing protein [Flavobacteriales bacterium]